MGNPGSILHFDISFFLPWQFTSVANIQFAVLLSSFFHSIPTQLIIPLLMFCKFWKLNNISHFSKKIIMFCDCFSQLPIYFSVNTMKFICFKVGLINKNNIIPSPPTICGVEGSLH